MEGIHEILSGFEAAEVLIVRATGLITVLLICALVTWDHIKSFRKGRRRRKGKNRTQKDQQRGI